jgi:Subtilase family
MKQKILIAFLLLLFLSPRPAAASHRFIVRDAKGITSLQQLCTSLGCAVLRGLDGTIGQIFLVTIPDSANPTSFLAMLSGHEEVLNAEPDVLLKLPLQPLAGAAPSGLWDSAPMQYFGVTVWHGFANQPASQIIRLGVTQTAFNVTGSGVVSVIDTGVDPTHPALWRVLTKGYDFTRNGGTGSELGDVNQSTMAVVNGGSPVQVNPSTIAVVSPTAAATLQNPAYAAFGHGTMVAGIIHLVAPTATIMPLKAFRPDGTGYISDVLRAIYFAVQNHANIINMSFSFPDYSVEMLRAVFFAYQRSLVAVASVGNDGKEEWLYPAGYVGQVIGVASTSDNDARSSFSNYGQPPVWVDAPGEGIITTYPFGTYSAGWGTSFSTAFVSGAAAVLRSVGGQVNPLETSEALSHAYYISPDLGYGRLDLYQTVFAARNPD